jgi:hypothetical protein
MKNVNISTYEYIIVLMNMIGISHNDVHLGNIISMPRKPSENVFHRFDYNEQVFDISPYGTMYDFARASSTFPVRSILFVVVVITRFAL